MKIGKVIRELRKNKDMTLRQLADTSGVALATLSRIETDKMIGTVQSHMAIASALGTSISELYKGMSAESSTVEFQSIKNRSDVFVHNDKASYQMLTANVLSKKMMPVTIKIEPGGETSQEELPGQAERFIYVLKGELNISVGSNNYTLKKNETLYFDASLPHKFKNARRDEEASAICISTPPSL